MGLSWSTCGSCPCLNVSRGNRHIVYSFYFCTLHSESCHGIHQPLLLLEIFGVQVTPDSKLISLATCPGTNQATITMNGEYHPNMIDHSIMMLTVGKTLQNDSDLGIPGDGHSSEERVTRDTGQHCYRDTATGTFLCHSKAIYRVLLCLQGCIVQCAGRGRCQPKLMHPVKRRPPSQRGYTPECPNVITTHSPKTRDQGMLIQGQLFYLVCYECWILLKSIPAPSAGRIFSLPLPLFLYYTLIFTIS